MMKGVIRAWEDAGGGSSTASLGCEQLSYEAAVGYLTSHITDTYDLAKICKVLICEMHTHTFHQTFVRFLYKKII